MESARLECVWQLPGVRAGSGLAWWGGRLLVVQDDAMSVVLVDPVTRETSTMALAPGGGALSKAEKPDFEAVLTLPDGALQLFGSGSTPRRRLIARLDPQTGVWTLIEASAFYAALEHAIGGPPNVEGAVVVGEALRLLHRGAGGSPNMVLEVPFSPANVPEPRVSAAWRVDLGCLGGVPLTFTDGVSLSDGRLLYLAVAEDTPNAVDDGPVVGLAVGVWTPGAPARWAPVRDPDGAMSTRKAEGLVLAPDGRSAYIITDPDDPERPAELGRLMLDGATYV